MLADAAAGVTAGPLRRISTPLQPSPPCQINAISVPSPRSMWRRTASAPSTARPAAPRGGGRKGGSGRCRPKQSSATVVSWSVGGVDPRLRPGPRQRSDVTVGAALLREQADLTVLGDKGYISAPLTDHPPPQPSGDRSPRPRRACSTARARLETVNDQLTEQFGLARPCPHLPGPVRPPPYEAGRAHPLPEPLAGARRFLTPQGVGLPQLAHGPTSY